MPTRTNRGADETSPTHVQTFNAGETVPHGPAVPQQPSIPQDSVPVADPQDVTMAIPLKQGPGQPVVPQRPPAVPPSIPLPTRQRGPRRWTWILLGIFMVLLLGGIGTWLGFQSAVQLRKDKAKEQTQAILVQQFMAGLVAQENKQYDIARQQFEFVIRADPTFPGAGDKLREVMMAMMIAQTPTLAPTVANPTMTPTPDMRPMEEIFNQVKQQYANKDWENVFATIDTLRTMDRTFHAIELDGMLYFALRFRGIDKILMQANLEGGLYDLAQAEQYGPLDVDAIGYRSWARQYLSGSSFWDVDWLRVMNAFEDVYSSFPNMRDGSGMTALDRYRIAASNYADQVVQKGDPCAAIEFYQKSLNAGPDSEVGVTATAVYLECYPATQTPAPAVVSTPIPTAATVGTPTVDASMVPPPVVVDPIAIPTIILTP